MTQEDLKRILSDLQSLPGENEIAEFKEAKNDYDFGKLGKYFSALSNEANLKGKPYAWMVLGIENAAHTIVGSKFKHGRKALDAVKGAIANKTTNRITFIDIYELDQPEGRVVMLQIPAAPRGIPIAFEGHYYGRDGEELGPLNIEEVERIRNQAIKEDWSAVIVPNADITDLEPQAITVAKQNYKNKFPDKAEEMKNWDDITFLNKARLTIKGKITRTAILLLGKEESEYFIFPGEGKIRWVLKDEKKNDVDYKIEGLPFLLAVDKIYSKIRNLTYRYIKDQTLFPEEVIKYEPYVIREAINNCIAHQDYTRGGRINVVEQDDELIFTNLGSFIPGSVERVVKENAPEEHYRNKFLATAMFNLKMVDTAGGGIRKMYNFQKDRYFPLPEYDLSENRVKVTITGKILDIDFARLLARKKDLSLDEIMMLDKVQKQKRLNKSEEIHLRQKHLIEGKKPNYYISLEIAQKTGQKAAYTKNKPFDQEYYLDLILKCVKEHSAITRQDIDDLLWNKLPEWMEDKQRKTKINNLIATLRHQGKITNEGNDRVSKWVLP